MYLLIFIFDIYVYIYLYIYLYIYCYIYLFIELFIYLFKYLFFLMYRSLVMTFSSQFPKFRKLKLEPRRESM